MERDFMGLKVKQEILEETTDPAVHARSSAMQWSFPNKAHPQYLSFKGNAQDQNKPKTGFESLASTGLVTITTTEAVDSIHRPYSAVSAQKNMNYPGTTCPPRQFGAHSVQQSPVANQTHRFVSASTSMPGRQPFISSAGHNLVSSHVNAHSARGAQITSPISNPPTRNGIVGTTELRGSPKTSKGPAQLTIFYAGSVSVFDNISPEKAQAIMLLAGNAPPVTSTTSTTTSPIQKILKSPSVDDAFVISSTTPIISSHIPITSHGSSQSNGMSSNTNEVSIIKSVGVLKSLCHIAQPSIVISSQESRPPASHNLSAVPQARKASLARFLEKRKERVVNTSPYANIKQTPQCTTPGSGNWSFSVNSSCSSALPATS